jgi:hypothetical protein
MCFNGVLFVSKLWLKMRKTDGEGRSRGDWVDEDEVS